MRDIAATHDVVCCPCVASLKAAGACMSMFVAGMYNKYREYVKRQEVEAEFGDLKSRAGIRGFSLGLRH